MVKLVAPLLSLEAHGTLQKTLTFKGQAERSHAHLYSTHPDTRTQAQLNQRAHFVDARRSWNLLTDADKITFAQSYQLPHMTPFAVWTQYIINRELLNPNWMHPQHQTHDIHALPFWFFLPWEIRFVNLAVDISGRHAHHPMAGAQLVQGDRASCLYNAKDLTDYSINNTDAQGDLDEFTFCIRLRPDYDQPDFPANAVAAYCFTDANKTGFSLIFYSDCTHLTIGDGTDTDALIFFQPVLANTWYDYVFIFGKDAPGHTQAWCNGVLLAQDTLSVTTCKSNTRKYSLGRFPWGYPFHGAIDNAIMYHHATNATET